MVLNKRYLNPRYQKEDFVQIHLRQFTKCLKYYIYTLVCFDPMLLLLQLPSFKLVYVVLDSR